MGYSRMHETGSDESI